MSHPDEGTIQMLLDDELDVAERRRVESHVAECTACAARLAEAREFFDEADRLVGVLQVPTAEPRRRTAPRRRALVRTIAWAASIVIAVGVGYWGRGADTTTMNPAVLENGDPEAKTNLSALPAEPPAEPAPAASVTPRATQPLAERPARVERPTANELARTEVADEVARWRVISMEEAVRLLGGQLRLIDGLTPDRVETGPGTAVAGADPALPLVRVVYAAGTVVLDQQRPAGVVAAESRQRDAAKAVGGVAAAAPATAWRQQGDIRFVVTGSVSTDSLRALSQRVR